ncbi:MAG: UDP-4-amino-4,6-dideoxy-N-acetyl-beta-L-altrosamine transaminase [Candidatus Tisiphia sp.]
MIPYGRQEINQDDIEAVVKVLKSDFLTQGPVIKNFEDAVIAYTRADYACATNSATSALHIACKALGVGRNDYVWTSPNSFVASANCARYCEAHIDFIDINPVTYNIDVDKLFQKLELCEKVKKLPKVIIPVHFAGQSCDMKSIYELSKHYGFKIIEDAAHALGGKFYEDMIGSCLYSDITIFSFQALKIITSGEGGMAVTKNKELHTKMELYRSHAITRNPTQMLKANEGGWYYEQIDLGYNYRMTDIQAALGISQLNRIDEFVKKRNEIASIYKQKLEILPINLPKTHTNIYNAFHLYVIQLNLNHIKKNRLQIFQFMREKGIEVHVHYIPIHTQPYYQKIGFK